MAKRGKGYGSEDNFLRYRQDNASTLNDAVLRAAGCPLGQLDWIYPSSAPHGSQREPEGLSFLTDERALRKWRAFWPQTGRQQTWDGVAWLRSSGAEAILLLMEAKANQPEFCSPPCAASKISKKKIERALGKTKRFLQVHRWFPWTGTYYQYTNRLAVLYFLTEIVSVPARLIHVYFVGDIFPDSTPCPSSEHRWQELIQACHLTLGLPETHLLSAKMHNVFLPALLKPTDALLHRPK